MKHFTISGFAASRWIAMLVAIGASESQALASQGPGTTVGGASATTQLAMAIVVYGISAAILAAGLIGALRR
jgi:hypothetical protein